MALFYEWNRCLYRVSGILEIEPFFGIISRITGFVSLELFSLFTSGIGLIELSLPRNLESPECLDSSYEAHVMVQWCANYY